MIENGMFVINGIECVIVLQLYCLFGVFFDYDKGKIYLLGKVFYNVCVIFYCGLWLDFEFDLKDNLFVCIDCCCKLFVIIILCVLEMMLEEILDIFFDKVSVWIDKDKLMMEVVFDCLCGEIVVFDIIDGEGNVVVEIGCCVFVCYICVLEKVGFIELEVFVDYLIGCVFVVIYVNEDIGEVIVSVNDEFIFENFVVLS